MNYLTISTSKNGIRKQVVRHLKDGKKLTSKTFHVHLSITNDWLYQKLPSIYSGKEIVAPAVIAILPGFGKKHGKEEKLHKELN